MDKGHYIERGMADSRNGGVGSGPHWRSQFPHRRSQDPRNGGRQTAIGRDSALDLKVCDQRRARKQELRLRTNMHCHPGGREDRDTSFVCDGRDAR